MAITVWGSQRLFLWTIFLQAKLVKEIGRVQSLSIEAITMIRYQVWVEFEGIPHEVRVHQQREVAH